MTAVLIIAPRDLAECVLALGAAAHARRVAEDVEIVCTPEARPLFRAWPRAEITELRSGLDQVGALTALTLRSAAAPFAVLIDFDGQPAARAIAARERALRRPAKVLRHLVEDFSELVAAAAPIAPRIEIDAQARAAAEAAAPGARPLLMLAPGADHLGLRWPPDRFAALARRLAGGAGPLAKAEIIIAGDADDAGLASQIAASLDADGLSARDLAGRLDLLGQAALCERAMLVIGNDAPLTHIAAAMGAPTLGLYGPSDERVRGPYGPRARAVRGRDFAEIAAESHGALDTRAWVADVGIDAVEEAALELLRAGGLH